MSVPVFDLAAGTLRQLAAWCRTKSNGFALWPLDAAGQRVEVAVLSMGNPHAVLRVEDVDAAPVAGLGPAIEGHARFTRRVNAGFMQIQSRAADRAACVRARRR